jgi:hypothetical protein
MRYMIWLTYVIVLVIVASSIFQWYRVRRERELERVRREQNIAEERAWIAAHGSQAQRARLAAEAARKEG